MGRISAVQRFSLDDGPGIRTTVFMKGCPLSCRWCHNPECIGPEPALMFHEDRCVLCGACAQVCQNGVHSVAALHTIDRQRCVGCGRCAAACPTAALELNGREISPDALAALMARDRVYYRNSGGGATFSGGEPLTQVAFCAETMRLLREDGIGVCVDTSGDVPWSAFETVLPLTDIFLFDLKTESAALHAALTGRDNGRIHENFSRLVRVARVIVRVPLVAGLNDSDIEVGGIARRIADAGGVELVELLRFHSMGASKYRALGLPYACAQASCPDDAHMARLVRLFEPNQRVRCK